MGSSFQSKPQEGGINPTTAASIQTSMEREIQQVEMKCLNTFTHFIKQRVLMVCFSDVISENFNKWK